MGKWSRGERKGVRGVRAWIAVMVAVCLLTESTGCGAAEEEAAEAAAARYQNHLDISLAYWQIDGFLNRREEDKVLEILEDKFNITIVPQNITWDDYYNKLRLWAETGELPDLFVGANRQGKDYYQWINQGLLHEIPDDLSDYPNLEEYLNNPEKESCMVDGKTYCIFRQTYSEQAETVKDRTIAYRWDLAQKAGIKEEPKNWDEFRAMIQAIIKKDSEGTGIGGMTAKNYSMLMGVLFTYSIPLASAGGSSYYWVPKGKDYYVPALFAGEKLGDDAVPTWVLARDMYTEGTIEQDIFLTTTAQAEEKFLMGRSAAFCFDGGIGNSNFYENIVQYWKQIHGRDFLEDVKFLDLMPSVTGELYYPIWGRAWSESYINANVSDEKLERILALYDYMLSEEGMLLTKFGIEGDTYRLEEDGDVVLLGEKAPSDVYPSIGMLASLVCWNYGNQDPSRFPNTVPEEYVRLDEERVEIARNCEIPKYNYEYTKKVSQMDDCIVIDIDNIFQRIVLGKEPVKRIWNKIIEEYKDMGLRKMIQKVNHQMTK